MPFDLHIKNIGKLTDAKLRIERFTVLAGPNNTGKTFVSKILYSLFDAMNANHLELYVHRQTSHAREWLQNMKEIGDPLGKLLSDGEDVSALALVDLLITQIDALEKQVAQLSDPDTENLNLHILALAESISENFKKLSNDPVAKTLREIPKALTGIADRKPEFFSALKQISSQGTDDILRDVRRAFLLEDLENFPVIFQKIFVNLQKNQVIFSSIKDGVKSNLAQNFQTSSLARLWRDQKCAAEISLPEIGKFTFAQEKVDCNINAAGLHRLQRYSNVLYLESPAYWKLKSPLESIRLSPRYRHTHRTRLDGVPGYFYDLASALRAEYTGEMDFPELHAKLTGKDVLGGKLVISDTGEILFRENGRSFPLSVTATGIINLGILALLIERKILDRDSFIFIDEPEAHLHPAWQVEMAKASFELAKGGAHVVIATHSADILKWLEVHIKKNPDDEKIVALNQFPAGAADGEEQGFADKMAAIKQGLTKPFADLYMEGL